MTRESGGSSFAGSVEADTDSESGILGAPSVHHGTSSRNNSTSLASLQFSNDQIDRLRMLLLGSPSSSLSPPTTPSTRHATNASITTQKQPDHSRAT
ncbi:unnamed protein product [Linum trigynum]|uniref:Uncharacterized protein n=1 Tax=Linum trigynum TaxID=586398 RepID=A0AAV2CEB1_9ROSI